MEDLQKLSVLQLREIISKENVELPTKGTGQNNRILKSDLISAIISSRKSKSIHEMLPHDMTREIALKVSIDDIHNLCEVNMYYKELCNDITFWKDYLNKDPQKFSELLLYLINIDDNLFLFLWKNVEKLGFKRDDNLYKLLYDKATDLNKEDLVIKIWRLAPDKYRSYFHEDVVDKLNNFFKLWKIAPTINPKLIESEGFYFRPNTDEDFEYTLYVDMEPIEEWEELRKLTLFSGQFFNLVADNEYSIYQGIKVDPLDVKSRDKISRLYRSGSNISVEDILRHAAYLGYNPKKLATERSGVIESIWIDKNTKYPTLVIEFETI